LFQFIYLFIETNFYFIIFYFIFRSIQQTLLVDNDGKIVASFPDSNKAPSKEEIQKVLSLFKNNDDALSNGIAIFSKLSDCLGCRKKFKFLF
jgi:hypothetical protein